MFEILKPVRSFWYRWLKTSRRAVDDSFKSWDERTGLPCLALCNIWVRRSISVIKFSFFPPFFPFTELVFTCGTVSRKAWRNPSYCFYWICRFYELANQLQVCYGYYLSFHFLENSGMAAPICNREALSRPILHLSWGGKAEWRTSVGPVTHRLADIQRKAWPCPS